jgi:hypothetical protein
VSSDEIPEDVRRFLLEHVEGYEHLEVIALLRPEPGRAHSPDAVAAVSELPASAAEAALSDLQRSGILVMETDHAGPRYRYFPQLPEVEATITRLLDTHRENPLGIVKVMNAVSIERVRSSARRAFAGAFDPEDGAGE